MKRKTFLASLLGMLALPFTLSAKKEDGVEWIIRESFIVYQDESYEHEAKQRLLEHVWEQAKKWETGEIDHKGNLVRRKHLMVTLKLESKEYGDKNLKSWFKKKFSL